MKKELTKKETVVLDGLNHGFVIYSMITQDYVRNKTGKIVLFRNIDLARVYAAVVKKLYNPYDYSLYICIYDSFIDYEFFEMIDGCYQLYATFDDTTNMKYFIKPTVNINVKRIGYFVFNGGEATTNKEKGVAKCNTYRTVLLNTLNDLLKHPDIKPNISSITKDIYGFCASVKNSTAKIHICYNSQIMTINQERKNNGLRALRFDKDMDKYTTLYCFVTIDQAEIVHFNGIENAMSIIDTIAKNVVNGTSIMTCEFKELELLYPIFLEDSGIVKGRIKRG